MAVEWSVEAIPPKPSPWPRRILRIGLVWAAILILLMGAQQGASPEDRTLAISISASGLYTLLLYRTRDRWLPRLAGHPLRNAMILGSANAAVIETLFLVVEKIMGAEGVAAHPNLIMDLLVTMPWYIGMVVIFVRVQHVRRFSPVIVLLLGGLYEIGADGFVGGAFGGSIFTPAFYLLIPAVFLWLFIPVYSSMVLPPAWVIATTPPPAGPDPLPSNRWLRLLAPKSSGPAWRDAVRPLLWILPFVLYLAVFLLLAAIVSEIV